MNAPLPTHLLSPQDTVAAFRPARNREWRDAFMALVATQGPERRSPHLDRAGATRRDPADGLAAGSSTRPT